MMGLEKGDAFEIWPFLGINSLDFWSVPVYVTAI